MQLGAKIDIENIKKAKSTDSDSKFSVSFQL